MPTLPLPTGHDLLERNRRFYDGLWRGARLSEPQRFNTWPLVARLTAGATQRLEVAPGLRPRFPLHGTCFVDISPPALRRLQAGGASVLQGQATALPFADAAFDAVCALDIIEHVVDDDGALAELSRVAKPGAAVLLSAPLHPASWTAFDDFVGHYRRYEPEQLLAKLHAHGLALEQSAVYGMQPKSSKLLDVGMWFLTHRREQAMRWYNRTLPLFVRFQKPLALVPGLVGTEQVDEVLLVCRKE
ncbi:class I SAM-dependent methyltransferase [Pseudoxanthomonas sacheonensis]|uniref:class I SAM-dependent methyltransferase n=1 Tax=Pseudoxanthomonas sacheonensis TaxID=443615 RepID=UPI0013D5114A|nr:class I SAM-dependent methyltransferase [Pseudoxanthomonas sacheonensis]KAF1706961.1 SAM-dependent methyltransferase [Pseudoxanthomonas sacheonensis]